MNKIDATHQKSLSIVFSFRNEMEVLPELIRRTREVLKGEIAKGIIARYEMIFVNDASTDDSRDILVRQNQDHNDIRIINMSRCFGPSPSTCVLAGMKYASGDAVIYMDTDLQDPPEMISTMLEAWIKDLTIDVVHTVRKSRIGESKIKICITNIGYTILNKITTVKLPAEAGDFKLLSRRVVNYLIQFEEKRPFLRGLVCWVGFKQVFVSYHREARFAGTTKFNVFGKDVVNNFFESALISFSSAPLKIAGYLGLGAIIIDIFLLAHVFLEKLQGRAIPGWTAIMITVIFFGSVQLLSLTIIGLYINSIFEESKRRPNYIVESTHGFPEGQGHIYEEPTV